MSEKYEKRNYRIFFFRISSKKYLTILLSKKIKNSLP